MEESMTPNRNAITITIVAVLALALPALLLSADGCGKKAGETSQETSQAQEMTQTQDMAQTRTPSDEASQAAPSGDTTAVGSDVVKVGSRVTLHYRGTLKDGSVFDQSREDHPLVFTAGTGQMIPGFDKAVMGMKVGEEKTFTIPAAEAYGPKNLKMIRNVPRSAFKEDFTAADGDQITIRNSAGLALHGVLVSQTPDSLLIDFNHPLAGQDLTFDIKIVSIQ
jgi:peptidylprolyl isomerase